ncbi:MAG: hypothetical protein P4L16_07485 [Chlamydiales bacterium]|nr:hypothetical protein [Chlamydiales bacterium]
MVESVKIYSIPQDAHTRYAHDTEASEGAFSRDVVASYLASSATTVMDRGPKYSVFEQLFSLSPKGIVYSESPPSFFTQLRSSVSKQAETLFGSLQNLDSMMEVIRNVTDKDKKDRQQGDEKEDEKEENESLKLTDVMQQLKILYRDRSFVYSKIGSLIQG